MGKSSFYLLLLLLLGGCSDVVTTHYQTYSDAAKDNLFGRGWLPDFIPSTSFNIIVSNDLDRNISEGEFSFPPVATASFVSKLRPYFGRTSLYVDYEKVADRRKAQGYILYEFTRDHYVWVFFLNREKGHGYYNMGPDNSSS